MVEGVGHRLGGRRLEDPHGPHGPGPTHAGFEAAGRLLALFALGDEGGDLRLVLGVGLAHAVGHLHQGRGEGVAVAGAAAGVVVGGVLPGPGQ